MERRKFLKNASLAGTVLALTREVPALDVKNRLPRWKGFNLLDFYSTNPSPIKQPTTEDHFKWMVDWGFNFIRLPIAYPYYLTFDRSRNIYTEEVYNINERAVEQIMSLVALAHKYNFHVCLNLHRAPGFCVNVGFHEPYNLWKDQDAQEAFYYHWQMWAKHYKNVLEDKISFNLLNEPVYREDINDTNSRNSSVPEDIYVKVIKNATNVIRKENNNYLIIADGNNGGSTIIPEIIGLNIMQSCRGYNPHAISHYKASWAYKDPKSLPEPKWPGQVGNQYLSREMLETYYQPWIELAKRGVGVHCGEAGCWNKTPYEVFIKWFTDVLSILSQNNIGFAIWNFIGDFGILDSGRIDVTYEDWNGHKLDRRLLELLMKY